jgi:hypothetical protein
VRDAVVALGGSQLGEPIMDNDEVRKLCIRMQARRGGEDLMFLWSNSEVRVMRLSDGACVGDYRYQRRRTRRGDRGQLTGPRQKIM